MVIEDDKRVRRSDSMPKSAEKPPKFLIRSSAGKVNHLFSIDSNAVGSVLKILEGSSTSYTVKKPGNESTPLFGSISADGCLQIWDLLKRRPILTLDTHLVTTSWARMCPRIPPENEESSVHRTSDLEFLLYSRKSGLYRQRGDILRKNSLLRLPLDDVHCGFCKPLLISSDVLICPCGSDSIAKMSVLNSEGPTIEQITTSGPVTFLQNIPGTRNRILLGTEDGKVSLLDVSSSTVVAFCNLNEFVTDADPTEGSLVPLCSDGDETTGHYLVGTAAEELILLELRILTENENEGHLSLTKVVKVHRRGTSCIKLRPDKSLAVVAGWDTRLRLFNFPGLKHLATLSCHSMTVSSLLFLPIPVGGGGWKSDSDLEQSGTSSSGGSYSRSLTSTGGVGGHYLLSASHDSTVAVWDDFGK